MPHKTVLNRYYDAPNCCKDFREFEYEKLAISDSKKIRIDENSKAFVFDTGKSYFTAFELPSYLSPYRISIKSYMIGENMEKGYIFSTVILFLTGKYQVTRMMERDLFRYKKTSLSETWGLRRKLEGTIHMTHDHREERSMIVFTTEELLELKEEDGVPIAIPFAFPGIGAGAIPTGMKKRVLIPHSPIGTFTIELFENGD